MIFAPHSSLRGTSYTVRALASSSAARNASASKRSPVGFSDQMKPLEMLVWPGSIPAGVTSR